MCLPVWQLINLCGHWSTSLSISLSVCPSVCLPVDQFVCCLSVFLSFYSSSCLSDPDSHMQFCVSVTISSCSMSLHISSPACIASYILYIMSIRLVPRSVRVRTVICVNTCTRESQQEVNQESNSNTTSH